MILLKLKGEKVIGLVHDISPTYQPNENEVMIDSLPSVDLNTGERAYLYWRNGQIEYKKESNLWHNLG